MQLDLTLVPRYIKNIQVFHTTHHQSVLQAEGVEYVLVFKPKLGLFDKDPSEPHKTTLITVSTQQHDSLLAGTASNTVYHHKSLYVFFKIHLIFL